MRRIAVIGSGATALAVLDVLVDRTDLNVSLIRPDRRLSSHGAKPAAGEPADELIAAAIGALRRELGLKFPPPKSHFGVMPERIDVKGWGKIWRSNLHGGLTQFWGGSMVPFTDRELAAWPITRADLEADYQAIAERVGITGADDALRGYLQDRFADLPPVKAIAPIELLIGRLSHVKSNGFDIIGGVPRVAVETRGERDNACAYLGECMMGCRQGAVFNALGAIELHRAKGGMAEECCGFAEHIDIDKKTVTIRREDGSYDHVQYDLVFICASCVHSVELTMNSLETEPETPISDNLILSFPVLYGGRIAAESRSERFFALTNGKLMLLPHAAGATPIFIQLYPNPDYFWQYNFPRWSWSMLHGLARTGRNRLFFARAYLASGHSQRYRMTKGTDGVELTLDQEPDTTRFFDHIWPQLRQNFSAAGFWVPPVPPLKAKTSSHYSGGFPMGGRWVGKDGALGNGAFLCDSANFPDCPALSHTFTAMANARRIARLALLG